MDGERNGERYFFTSKKLIFTPKMKKYTLKKSHFPKKYYKLALGDMRARQNFKNYSGGHDEKFCKIQMSLNANSSTEYFNKNPYFFCIFWVNF